MNPVCLPQRLHCLPPPPPPTAPPLRDCTAPSSPLPLHQVLDPASRLRDCTGLDCTAAPSSVPSATTNRLMLLVSQGSGSAVQLTKVKGGGGGALGSVLGVGVYSR